MEMINTTKHNRRRLPKRQFLFFLLYLSIPSLLSATTTNTTLPEQTADGFRIPQPHAPLSFPRDHANHPEYKIEWWYITGHFTDDLKNNYGFQATFFRTATEPGKHLHLAHVALTDIATGRFFHQERLLREGWDAFADNQTLNLRNANWSLRQIEPDTSPETFQLDFTVEANVTLQLTLTAAKPLVRFGEDGTSRKGSNPAARSFYLSFTRLQLNGTLQTPDTSSSISGLAWMDHEIASMQLDPNLQGWDWTAIQFDDGTELKAYILRRNDGSPDPFSARIWIDAAGTPHSSGTESFRWETLATWKSPHTGATYPTNIAIHTHDLSGHPQTYILRPLSEDQELTGESGAGAYWEGACSVHSPTGKLIGRAYLELVGYAGPIRGL